MTRISRRTAKRPAPHRATQTDRQDACRGDADRTGLQSSGQVFGTHPQTQQTQPDLGGNFAAPGHHRTGSKGCRGCGTGPAITFLPTMPAQKKWRKPDGLNRLPANIGGIELRVAIRLLPAAA